MFRYQGVCDMIKSYERKEGGRRCRREEKKGEEEGRKEAGKE